MGCRARVWDNGDTADCDEPVVRADRCGRCIIRDVSQLSDDILLARRLINKAAARIKELLGGQNEPMS